MFDFLSEEVKDELGLKNRKCNEDDDCDTCDDDDDYGLGIEDDEDDALIAEAHLLGSLNACQLEEFLSEDGLGDSLVKMGILSEKSIVRLDKIAKLSRAEKQAVYMIAKEKGDRDYKKLNTVWKLKKLLTAKLEKRYGVEAKRRAKTMVKKVNTANPVKKFLKK